jgi:mediator of RNA polymerase II transcription subunit 16
MDTLFALPETLPPHISLTDINKLSLDDVLDHIRSQNMISLHLLLSSTSRGFLTAICRLLAHLDYIARKAMQRSVTTPQISQTGQTPPSQQSAALSPALKAAYTQIATLTSSSIIRVKTIETLLLSLGTRVKTAYAAAGPSTNTSTNPQAIGTQRSGGSDSPRNVQEMKMLYGGTFPECFKAVIIELYRKEGGLLESVRNEIDPAKLFFANFEVLEVDEDVNLVNARKAKDRTMDCFKKNWLVNPVRRKGGVVVSGNGVGGGNAGGKQWRRCARCAAVMEDVLPNRAVLQWLVMQQRRCFCSGYWYTLAIGDGSAS